VSTKAGQLHSFASPICAVAAGRYNDPGLPTNDAGSCVAVTVLMPLRQTALVSMPETGYARTNHGSIGYQVLGDGPPDLLVTKPIDLPVDLMRDEPRLVRFLTGLSSFSRHIWFDQRGTGSSDSMVPVEARLNESLVDDMIAVLDELSCERVAVLGIGPFAALQFAATHPERTSALVLINPTARFGRTSDYPEGYEDEGLAQVLLAIEHRWGTGVMLRILAPRMGADANFARWGARCERLSLPPQDAYRNFRAAFEADLRPALAAIRVPTAVIVRAGSRGYEQGRYVAEHIEGARYVELAGEDPLFFLGDTESLLDAVEEFVTGRRERRDVDRVLATVMFTDVVGSTAQAARMGDRRWSERLAVHDGIIRTELERFRGREIKRTGDGFLATFDGPGRAVRCACAIRDAVRPVGIEVRVGLHAGEIELRGDDIGGIAVHIAQRVQALAQPNEVLVSRTVADLVGGSGIAFADRGTHTLKGVPDPWQLSAVEDPELRSGAGGELVG
jgi:class 3 adenylate cyclase